MTISSQNIVPVALYIRLSNKNIRHPTYFGTDMPYVPKPLRLVRRPLINIIREHYIIFSATKCHRARLLPIEIVCTSNAMQPFYNGSMISLSKGSIILAMFPEIMVDMAFCR